MAIYHLLNNMEEFYLYKDGSLKSDLHIEKGSCQSQTFCDGKFRHRGGAALRNPVINIMPRNSSFRVGIFNGAEDIIVSMVSMIVSDGCKSDQLITFYKSLVPSAEINPTKYSLFEWKIKT